MPRIRRFNPDDFRDDVSETGTVGDPPNEGRQSISSDKGSNPCPPAEHTKKAKDLSSQIVTAQTRLRISDALMDQVRTFSKKAKIPEQKVLDRAAYYMNGKVEELSKKFDPEKYPSRKTGPSNVRVNVRMDKGAYDTFISNHDPYRMNAKSAPQKAWAEAFFEDALIATLREVKGR